MAITLSTILRSHSEERQLLRENMRVVSEMLTRKYETALNGGPSGTDGVNFRSMESARHSKEMEDLTLQHLELWKLMEQKHRREIENFRTVVV